MSRSRLTQRAAFAVVSLSVASLAVAAPAIASATNPADPNFDANAAASATPDFVGVGSDTSQLALHYLAEGSGDVPGFNAGKSAGRIASFAADGTPAQIVLRTGSGVVNRPNGSGPGKAALFGSGNNTDVSFARSSSALSASEISGSLQAFPFAVDGLRLAVRTAGSNAPDTITDAQLVGIYKGDITDWSAIGGTAGTIKPLIPQAGSGTRSFFVAQLKARNGGVDVALGGNVTETQEHSDAAIKDDPNAVAPFSTGRAKGTPTVELVSGTGSFVAKRALYNVLRGVAPGGATPDAQKPEFLDVFGSDGFICSPAAKPLIEAAGFDQLALPSDGGVCGVPTQSATSNFSIASAATSTTLTAKGSPNGIVRLAAEVSPSGAAGQVAFFEVGSEDPLGSSPVTDGEALLTLEEVSKGEHTYRAVFTPTNTDDALPSTSDDVTTSVDDRYDGVLTVTNPATTWGNAKTITATLKSDGNNAVGAVKLVYGDAPEISANLVSGVATFTLPATLAAGSYWGVVHYAGADANFAKDFKLVKIVVTKATTKSTVKMAAASVKVKKATSATVTVTVNGTTEKANGTVTLKVGAAVVGTGKVVNGTAKVAVKAQTVKGRKVVVGTFTPSTANYGASVAPAVAYTVVK